MSGILVLSLRRFQGVFEEGSFRFFFRGSQLVCYVFKGMFKVFSRVFTVFQEGGSMLFKVFRFFNVFRVFKFFKSFPVFKVFHGLSLVFMVFQGYSIVFQWIFSFFLSGGVMILQGLFRRCQISRVFGFQGSRVSGFSVFRASRFQGFREGAFSFREDSLLSRVDDVRISLL